MSSNSTATPSKPPAAPSDAAGTGGSNKEKASPTEQEVSIAAPKADANLKAASSDKDTNISREKYSTDRPQDNPRPNPDFPPKGMDRNEFFELWPSVQELTLEQCQTRFAQQASRCETVRLHEGPRNHWASMLGGHGILGMYSSKEEAVKVAIVCATILENQADEASPGLSPIPDIDSEETITEDDEDSSADGHYGTSIGKSKPSKVPAAVVMQDTTAGKAKDEVKPATKLQPSPIAPAKPRPVQAGKEQAKSATKLQPSAIAPAKPRPFQAGKEQSKPATKLQQSKAAQAPAEPRPIYGKEQVKPATKLHLSAIAPAKPRPVQAGKEEAKPATLLQPSKAAPAPADPRPVQAGKEHRSQAAHYGPAARLSQSTTTQQHPLHTGVPVHFSQGDQKGAFRPAQQGASYVGAPVHPHSYAATGTEQQWAAPPKPVLPAQGDLPACPPSQVPSEQPGPSPLEPPQPQATSAVQASLEYQKRLKEQSARHAAKAEHLAPKNKHSRPPLCEIVDHVTKKVLQEFATYGEAEMKTKVPCLLIKKLCKEGGGLENGYYFRHCAKKGRGSPTAGETKISRTSAEPVHRSPVTKKPTTETAKPPPPAMTIPKHPTPAADTKPPPPSLPVKSSASFTKQPLATPLPKHLASGQASLSKPPATATFVKQAPPTVPHAKPLPKPDILKSIPASSKPSTSSERPIPTKPAAVAETKRPGQVSDNKRQRDDEAQAAGTNQVTKRKRKTLEPFDVSTLFPVRKIQRQPLRPKKMIELVQLLDRQVLVCFRGLTNACRALGLERQTVTAACVAFGGPDEYNFGTFTLKYADSDKPPTAYEYGAHNEDFKATTETHEEIMKRWIKAFAMEKVQRERERQQQEEEARRAAADKEPRDLCMVCQTASVQIVFQPCHHSVLCRDCAEKSCRQYCPLCRTTITGRLQPNTMRLVRPRIYSAYAFM